MKDGNDISSCTLTDKEKIDRLERLLAKSDARLESVEQGYEATIKSMEASLQATLERERFAHEKEIEAQKLTHTREVETLKADLERLFEQIRIANAVRFGAKSERVMPNQLSLFNDMEAAYKAGGFEPELDVEPSPRRRRAPRKIDTSNMVTVVIDHTLEGDEALCDECGAELKDIRTEVRRIVKLIPAHFEVEEHRRHVYVCPDCSTLNAEGDGVKAVFKRAEIPHMPLEKSWAHPSLIAGIINSKYVNAMPLYRIQADLKSIDPNMEVSRQCMAGWVITVYKRWLSLIHTRMKEKLLEQNLLHMDETTTLVLKEPNRLPSQKSYMWVVATSADDIPICVFEYRDTRAATVPKALLKNWRGTLMTDCYAAYFSLENVENLACLVHIRRGFLKVIEGVSKTNLEGVNSYAAQAINMINRMFSIDHKFSEMEPDERKEERAMRLRPVMETFQSWLYAHVDETVPKSKLNKAFKNAIKHWPDVMNVLKDGRFPLTNNRAEQLIRPFCVGRKNWLFSDTTNGAEASAAIYSIVATARANGCIPGRYIEWLLTIMPNTEDVSDASALNALMPWSEYVPAWVKAKADASSIEPDDPIVDVDPCLLDDVKELETS